MQRKPKIVARRNYWRTYAIFAFVLTGIELAIGNGLWSLIPFVFGIFFVVVYIRLPFTKEYKDEMKRLEDVEADLAQEEIEKALAEKALKKKPSDVKKGKKKKPAEEKPPVKIPQKSPAKATASGIVEEVPSARDKAVEELLRNPSKRRHIRYEMERKSALQKKNPASSKKKAAGKKPGSGRKQDARKNPPKSNP